VLFNFNHRVVTSWPAMLHTVHLLRVKYSKQKQDAVHHTTMQGLYVCVSVYLVVGLTDQS
jgi:hypothetical protein